MSGFNAGPTLATFIWGQGSMVEQFRSAYMKAACPEEVVGGWFPDVPREVNPETGKPQSGLFNQNGGNEYFVLVS